MIFRAGLSTSVSAVWIGVVFLAFGVGSADAQSLDILEGLPGSTQSLANAISADGTTVVGFSSGGGSTQAWHWVNGATTALGFLGTDTESRASGVNSDGAVIVGESGGWMETRAFRWVGGTMTDLGVLGNDSSSGASGVSADGNVVVGYSRNQSGRQAFRWEDGTMTGLGFLGTGTESYANATNGDGSVVVGSSRYDSGNENQAFRWVDDGSVSGSMDGLGFLGTGTESEASAVNADGTVVVGSSAISHYGNNEAFRWVEGQGMTGLGHLVGTTYSYANAVSADGNVVVGYSTTHLGNSSLAFRWVDGDPAGMVSIADLLNEAGVDATGWKLQYATGVSADGSTVVGWGMDFATDAESWIARFGPAPGLITPDEAVNSLLTLGQVPNVASSLVYNFLDTTSEYARQHAAAASTPDIQPLGYGDDGVSPIVAVKTRPLRVFGYGLGGAAFDEDGWSGSALIGASVAVTDHLVVGGSLGYGAVNSGMGMGGEATIRGPAGTVFIASTPETGFQFLAAGTIVGLDAEIHRSYVNGSGHASSYGETDGAGYGGLVRAGYAIALDDRNRLEPFASYQAVHADLGAYTETGGPFPAEISEMSQTDQVGRLGAELRHRYHADAWIWGSAAWAHRLDDSGIDLAVQLIDLFGVSGTAPVGASDWMELTAGVSLPVGVTTRLTGSVTAGVFGEGADTLLGRVGVSMAF